MNRKRRKILKQVLVLLEQAADILEDVKEQEEEAYGNLPEVFQAAGCGELMGEYIDNMESMLDSMEELENMLDEIINV